MDIRVLCECGAAIVVSEGAAGTMQTCSCGRTVEIPSVRRKQRASARPSATRFRPQMGLAADGGDEATAILCNDCERYHPETKAYTVLYIVFAVVIFSFRTAEVLKCPHCMRRFLVCQFPLAMLLANVFSPLLAIWWCGLFIRTFFRYHRQSGAESGSGPGSKR
jgi:hypothetical protein